MKIAFFGTSNFALPILEALNRHYQVVAAVTTPDAPVGRRQDLTESPVSALGRELKLNVLKPERLKGNGEIHGRLKDLGAEMFVVAAYGRLLPAEIISLPKHQTLNVHPSLLPKYRGASPIQTALLDGETKTGTSIILLDEQMDHGPVLAQREIAIDSDDNFFTLSDRLARESAKVLIEVIPGFVGGTATPLPQDDSKATFTKIISKQDGRIFWEKSAREIYNQFRAFYPWPGIWAKWNGKTLKIAECRPADHSSAGLPAGKVLEGGMVACGSGSFLQIARLQLEGKNETGIGEFLNGYREFVGSTLG